jgi:hypothetical protein
VSTTSLDRRLERIEKDTRICSADLALLLREALAAHGRDAVVAVCERVGIDLETAERWAAEPWAKQATNGDRTVTRTVISEVQSKTA